MIEALIYATYFFLVALFFLGIMAAVMVIVGHESESESKVKPPYRKPRHKPPPKGFDRKWDKP